MDSENSIAHSATPETCPKLKSLDKMTVKEIKDELDARKWPRPGAGRMVLIQKLLEAREAQGEEPNEGDSIQFKATQSGGVVLEESSDSVLFSAANSSKSGSTTHLQAQMAAPAIVQTSSSTSLKPKSFHLTPRWSRNDMARLVHVIRDPSCGAELVRVSFFYYYRVHTFAYWYWHI